MSPVTQFASSLALVAALSGAAMALGTDAQEPVQIEADSARLDNKRGAGTYRGNVKVTQGSMVMTGDTIVVHAPGKKLDKVVADGQLATFRQLTDDGREIKARAEHMELLNGQNKVVLEGKATLDQGGNSFSGERIEYDTVSEVVDATGRIKMIIIPEDASTQ